MYFGLTSWGCNQWAASTKRDVHNSAAASIADFTKAFFVQFADLSVGVISVRASDDASCC
jgi:hypothetical protein